MYKIVVVGVGYVGLVTGCALAKLGNEVIGLDIDSKKIEKLKKGFVPIYEAELDDLLKEAIEKNKIEFIDTYSEHINNVDFIILAVGTPENEDGSANLKYIYQAAENVAKYITKDTIVIVKSTVPVGTNDKIESIINENLQYRVSVEVVSNPEFLREGTAVYDTFNGERIIIGSENKEAAKKVETLFAGLKIPIVHTNRRSAEMIKYAANAFLALKISYINEIARLCETTGANVLDVARGIGSDKRIGNLFLNAGVGYGGSCFPKDTSALINLGNQLDSPLSIVSAARKVNEEQKEYFLQKILKHFEYNVNGKIIAVLGLTFKPNTDDLRESPALYLIKELELQGAIIKAYDPVIKNLKYCQNSINETLESANAVVLVTEWQEFKESNWCNLSKLVNDKVIFDGRNFLYNEIGSADGWEYYGIGI